MLKSKLVFAGKTAFESPDESIPIADLWNFGLLGY